MLAGSSVPQEALDVSGNLGALGTFLALLALVVHVVLSVAIHQDAKRREEQAKPLAFVGPLVWAGAVLVGGLAGLGLYWAIHYSSLRDKDELVSKP